MKRVSGTRNANAPWSSHRNVSIPWNHPAEYGVYGIQHESGAPEGTAGGRSFGEAERMVDSEGGAACWIHAQCDREMVQERRDRWMEKDRNAILTLREECLDALPVDLTAINQALPAYLRHSVKRRHRFGLDRKTPQQVLQECVQAID